MALDAVKAFSPQRGLDRRMPLMAMTIREMTALAMVIASIGVAAIEGVPFYGSTRGGEPAKGRRWTN